MNARVIGRIIGLLLLATVLVACGNPSGGRSPVALRWWLASDLDASRQLARSCSETSGGAFAIAVKQLPADINARHADLLRRLAAGDDSLDILSLDSELTTEFAAAELLAPIPAGLAIDYSSGIEHIALTAAQHEEKLVVAPWWFEPQLLWFRNTAMERAGLNADQTITWDELLLGAERIGVTIEIDDPEAAGLSEWVNALLVGAGGQIVDGADRQAEVGLDSEAGTLAAGIVEFYAGSGLGDGPTATGVQDFAGSRGGFLLAPSSAVFRPELARLAGEIGWTAYPAVREISRSPVAGVSLAVPSASKNSAAAFEAISCLTSDDSLTSFMQGTGHAVARTRLFAESGIPQVESVLAARTSGAAVPATPYWALIRRGLDDSWKPVKQVTAALTPRASQQAVASRLRGELP